MQYLAHSSTVCVRSTAIDNRHPNGKKHLKSASVEMYIGSIVKTKD